MSYQTVHDLITENLKGTPKISPTKHKEVEFALLDYIETVKNGSLQVLYRGTYDFGDAVGTDQRRVITIPNVGVEYEVWGALKSKGTDWNKNNDVFWQYGETNITSFAIYLREVTGHTQDLSFNFFLLPKI